MRHFFSAQLLWKRRMLAVGAALCHLKQVLRSKRYHVIGGLSVVATATFMIAFGRINTLRMPVIATLGNFTIPASNSTSHTVFVVKPKEEKKHLQTPKPVLKAKEQTKYLRTSKQLQLLPAAKLRFQDKHKPPLHMDFGEKFYPEMNGSLIDLKALNGSKVISNARIVVVIAYMRTGSTLVGKLIEQHPGTFYLFEPIRSIVDAFRGERDAELIYLDGTKRHFRYGDLTNVVQTELVNWMACRLHRQSVPSLTNEFHRTYTRTMKQFYFCSRDYFSRRGRGSETRKGVRDLRLYSSYKFKIYDCLKRATQECINTPLIALKLIRLRVRQIEPLLPLFPNMKVIHLNRDPRGIFNSRIHLHLYKNQSFEQAIKKQCSEISDDLSTSKTIMQKYPGRLKIINYEDLAERPMSTAKEIYNFIDFDFTKNEKSFVERMTSSKRDTCKFCTERKNSSETAYKWRSQMANQTDFDDILGIQDMCRNSNRVMGYLPFSSVSQLIDTRVPSRKYFNVSQALLADERF